MLKLEAVLKQISAGKRACADAPQPEAIGQCRLVADLDIDSDIHGRRRTEAQAIFVDDNGAVGPRIAARARRHDALKHIGDTPIVLNNFSATIDL